MQNLETDKNIQMLDCRNKYVESTYAKFRERPIVFKQVVMCIIIIIENVIFVIEKLDH